MAPRGGQTGGSEDPASDGWPAHALLRPKGPSYRKHRNDRCDLESAFGGHSDLHQKGRLELIGRLAACDRLGTLASMAKALAVGRNRVLQLVRSSRGQVAKNLRRDNQLQSQTLPLN